jgi:GDPmannose 4,6-dehydratase
MTNALITGITGQDGSYLAELLISKGYTVFGLVRRSSQKNYRNIQHLIDNDSINLIEGDLTDLSSLIDAIENSKPDELYNMAAQSYVGTSWTQAQMTIDVTGIGPLRIMEAIKHSNLKDKIRMIQASSSEMFGNVGGLLNEDSPMRPRSPYGCAKVMAHNLASVYRDSYNLWISCSIGFNHSGVRRSSEFITRKISIGVAKIKLGLENKLTLGNIRAKRDWSDARDIVYGMWLMMQQEKPDDYVLASGESHSVREVCEIAFGHVGLNWDLYTNFDKSLIRPAEIFELVGDSSKAMKSLGWEPKIEFEQMIEEMVDNDIKLLQADDRNDSSR